MVNGVCQFDDNSVNGECCLLHLDLVLKEEVLQGLTASNSQSGAAVKDEDGQFVTANLQLNKFLRNIQ